MCFRHKEQYSTLFNYHEFNFELLQRNTARKAIFPISRRPEKMAFPKKLRWNIIFFKLSGKIRFFPQKYDLTPRWKMKDDLSKKKQGNMIFSWNVLILFPKRIALGHHLSCTIWKAGIFSLKTRYFFYPDGK